jgi:myo-inositol catabolism protein IolS
MKESPTLGQDTGWRAAWPGTPAGASRIGFGTWSHGGPREVGGKPVGWSGEDDDRSREALVAAWEQGIVHWDTADVYGDGHAEEIIGSLWEGKGGTVPRDEVFLASKVGWKPGPGGTYYEPGHVRRQLEGSLARLGVERLDLYYLHHCDFGPGDERFDDTVELLRRFRDEGKVRLLGLSDWDAREIARLAPAMEPDAVQPYRNVYDDHYRSSGLADWVEASGAGVAFFSPLKHGLLLGKYDEPATFPEGDMRSRIPEFGDAAVLKRFRAAREEIEARFPDREQPMLHALTGALLADAPTGIVLLGLRNAEQTRAAAHLGEPLSAEDAAWVRGLYR